MSKLKLCTIGPLRIDPVIIYPRMIALTIDKHLNEMNTASKWPHTWPDISQPDHVYSL